MNTRTLLVSLVLSLLVVAFAATVSANQLSVTVNGVENFGGNAGVFAGETIPVRVIFYASQGSDNVRISARLIGESGVSASTERFDVIAGSTYSRLINIEMPFDIDLNEGYELEVTVESREDGVLAERIVDFEVQRESYLVEILSVGSSDQVRAGQTLALDVVLKNRGRHFAEDTSVKVSIPELGISTTGYFGDLAPVDDYDDSDKEDAVERRLYLNIPSTAREGIYTMELVASNDDGSTLATKRVVVTGGQESRIVSSGATKTLGVGETTSYSFTLVNAGNEIKVYDLALEAGKELTVALDDSIVVVPAGTSKTVKMQVTAHEKGTYTFAVNVQSDGALVKKETFTATVEGASAKVNASVVLTVILAVIFVVLVIVLIVLLTRRTEKQEEYGESYY